MYRAETCLRLGIPAMAIFPVIEPGFKNLTAAEALNPDGSCATDSERAEETIS